MKTSVELDEEKLNLARKLGGTNSIKETLNNALDALIAQSRRQGMFEMLGTDFFDSSAVTKKGSNNATRARR